MTCIVGYLEESVCEGKTSISVWMGADSAGVGGWDHVSRKDKKVFFNGEFLIGFTTSFRMGQLLQYKFIPPEIPEGMDLFEYMVSLFVEEWRVVSRNAGFTERVNEKESSGQFLVAARGRLFCIYSDFQVEESNANHNTAGCGYAYAAGAIEAFNETGKIMDGEEVVLKALEIAERCSAGVRGPFNVERLDYEPEENSCESA
jgi:ATP-dependent protease HslVU (ClpYQ) peptidase subunit